MKINTYKFNNNLETKYGLFFYKSYYKNNNNLSLVLYFGNKSVIITL
jgi:hypothetical protein